MSNLTFIDQAKIMIKPGNGGSGKIAFHREKHVSRGGPSGGNGGNGGNVFFIADENENTLLDFRSKKKHSAIDGSNGKEKNMTGASGKDLYIKVPLGTEIYVEGKKKFDLLFHKQLFLIGSGGKGGRGNASFKSSKNTVPTLFEAGVKTNWTEINLSLKLLADVGLLGYPNSGKSTFLSVVSNAKPKIADYAFTTLVPKLGVTKYKDNKFVITDLPGLIEGSHLNKGMGLQFLRHLSRTKLILHLIDASIENPINKYKNLRYELKQYSKKLNTLTELIVITKIDLISDEEIKKIKAIFKNKNVSFISSQTQRGVQELLMKISNSLIEIKESEKEQISSDDFVHIKYEDEIKRPTKIKRENDFWILSGDYVEYWANRVPLTSHENQLRILAKFKSKGIIKKLEKMGIKENDMIVVKDSLFVIKY